jgi:hypothetical protein
LLLEGVGLGLAAHAAETSHEFALVLLGKVVVLVSFGIFALDVLFLLALAG